MSVSALDGALLCACGCAYYIDPVTNEYNPGSDPEKCTLGAHWKGTPTPFHSPPFGGVSIDACLVGEINLSDIFGDDSVSKDKVGIVVAFRGTLSKGDGEYADWIQDVIDCVPLNAPPLPGKVHEGFHTAVQSLIWKVRDAVINLRNGKEDTPVYITGHSKGGAMAPIAAYLMQYYSCPVEKVVTFAAPKSGDADFSAQYNAVFTNHTRYENYGDLVPFLCPPASAAQELSGLLQSEFPLLADALQLVMNFNYQPVGLAESYISAAYTIDTTTDLAAINAQQTVDLGFYVGENVGHLEAAFGNAHSISCGYGYRSAVFNTNCL